MRESISRRVVSITAGLLTAAPASALACPVCALVGTSDNTWAYQAMSAMLIVLPLAMIGALVWWLARLAARADTERQSAEYGVDRAPVGRAETYSVVARVE
jgi:flagellar biogenesis protein FliO